MRYAFYWFATFSASVPTLSASEIPRREHREPISQPSPVERNTLPTKHTRFSEVISTLNHMSLSARDDRPLAPWQANRPFLLLLTRTFPQPFPRSFSKGLLRFRGQAHSRAHLC